jgi:hypothetical protein
MIPLAVAVVFIALEVRAARRRRTHPCACRDVPCLHSTMSEDLAVFGREWFGPR